MSTIDINFSVGKDNSTKVKSENCLWGVDEKTAAQVLKKLFEAAEVAITSRKEEA